MNVGLIHTRTTGQYHWKLGTYPKPSSTKEYMAVWLYAYSPKLLVREHYPAGGWDNRFFEEGQTCSGQRSYEIEREIYASRAGKGVTVYNDVRFVRLCSAKRAASGRLLLTNSALGMSLRNGDDLFRLSPLARVVATVGMLGNGRKNYNQRR